LKIKAYDQLKEYPQIEALLRKLSEIYPQQTVFRKQLVKFYMNQQRPQEAEKELRAIVATDPKSVEAESDLVRFLFATKGGAAARDELVTRINAGDDIFPFQLALAELDYDQGRVSDSIRLLESLGESPSPENAIKAKIKLAELNLRQKNTDAADKIITDVLAKDTRNVDALKLRASIRLTREQFEGAISDLREALNDQPRSAELMLMLATAYERNGSIELADKQFADAIKASKYNVALSLSYVSFLRRHGGLDRSYDFLTELANRWPDNVQVLSALAEAKLARQDWAGAQEIGQTILRVSKARGIGDWILGAALSGEHKNDESIAAFQDAVAADPSAAQPMAALVSALVKANKTDKAVAFLQNVLKENPSSAEAYVLLGSIALAKSKPEEAEKNFRAAITAQPKDSAGYGALADLNIRQKNLDGALDALRDGLKEQPNSPSLEFVLAALLEKKGDYESAIEQYENILKRQPGSMIAINNLASLLADHRTDKASLDRARVLAASLRDSQVLQFKDTLGWINYREGDFKQAVPLLEAAVAGLPNVPTVHYHLGMSYTSIGEVGKASAQFKEALAQAPDPELEEKIKTELKKIPVQ
jgi:cellulose synthase operon protein C